MGRTQNKSAQIYKWLTGRIIITADILASVIGVEN